MEKIWLITRKKKVFGPFSESQMQKLATSGQLSSNDLVQKKESGEWKLAHEVFDWMLPPEESLPEAALHSTRKIKTYCQFCEWDGIIDAAEGQLTYHCPRCHKGIPVDPPNPKNSASEIFAGIDERTKNSRTSEPKRPGKPASTTERGDIPKRAKRNMSILFIPCGIGFLIMAIVFVNDFVSAYGSESWPKAECAVQPARVIVEQWSRSGRQYKADISYTYEVNGQAYQNNSYNTRRNYIGDENDAKQFAEKYKNNSKQTVAYNPKDPNEAYLLPGPTYHAYGRLAIAIVLIISGLLMIGFSAYYFFFEAGRNTEGRDPEIAVS